MQLVEGIQIPAVGQGEIGEHHIERFCRELRQGLADPRCDCQHESADGDFLEQLTQQPYVRRVVFDQQDLNWF